MAGLKELRTRIESIKSTQKITSAMKMVAAARLRRSQDLLSKSAAYNDMLVTTAGRIVKELQEDEVKSGVRVLFPGLMTPRRNASKHLLIAFASDRGLCGSYNAAVVKETLRRVRELQAQGREVKVFCIGKKIGDAIKHRMPEVIENVLSGVAAKGARFNEVESIVEPLIASFALNDIDVCEMVYTRFRSAINRVVVTEQLMPFSFDWDKLEDGQPDRFADKVDNAVYEYDTDKLKVLYDLMPMVIASAMFEALVNAQASEHGARMTSMDNATRNAKDMIGKLTLRYNRIRQTAITTELTEIIAGAEAI